MISKGTISSIEDGKVIAIPFDTKTALTCPLSIPWHLWGKLKTNMKIIYTMFEDNTGEIIGVVGMENADEQSGNGVCILEIQIQNGAINQQGVENINLIEILRQKGVKYDDSSTGIVDVGIYIINNEGIKEKVIGDVELSAGQLSLEGITPIAKIKINTELISQISVLCIKLHWSYNAGEIIYWKSEAEGETWP